MKSSIKAAWLTALRSGRFAQGQSKLRDDNKYCCLGVLCEIVEPNGWNWQDENDEGDIIEMPHKFADYEAEQLAKDAQVYFEIESFHDHLIKLNDGCNMEFEFFPSCDFATIANWIETNIPEEAD